MNSQTSGNRPQAAGGARLRRALTLLSLFLGFIVTGPAMAKPGDAKKGEAIYAKRCAACHGAEGDGLGPVAERLNPPPRDFTAGQYKIKTSGLDETAPNDDDLYRMIRNGMPGTAMPGWGDMLSEQDTWDLIVYIKAFAGFEEPPSQQLDYGERISSSAESIGRGKELFHQDDRCSECHGQEGKGDAIKRLKGDAGERTWPRDLAKPWTFRASNDPKDIFARVSLGIPGTQMPAFADPKNEKKLSIEERWHVANYVASLAETDKAVQPENTVVKAERVEGEVASAPDDKRWEATTPTTFYLVPQIIVKERFFRPSNDTITVRAMYNDKEISFLLEWDDRTQSIPGDEKAEKIADPPIDEDAVAVQLPVAIPDGIEKPYFFMGNAVHPVTVWQWKSGTRAKPASLALLNAKGFKDLERRDAQSAGIAAQGAYRDGAWRVVMKRARVAADSAKDLSFTEGQFIPIAFAAWDGSNSEKDSKHTMTTWYWLLLKPDTGAEPFVWALLAMGFVAAGQFWWIRSAGRKKP